MKLQLNEIMEATISELDDIDMTLAFEIEAIERQLVVIRMQIRYGERRL